MTPTTQPRADDPPCCVGCKFRYCEKFPGHACPIYEAWLWDCEAAREPDDGATRGA